MNQRKLKKKNKKIRLDADIRKNVSQLFSFFINLQTLSDVLCIWSVLQFIKKIFYMIFFRCFVLGDFFSRKQIVFRYVSGLRNATTKLE